MVALVKVQGLSHHGPCHEGTKRSQVFALLLRCQAVAESV